MKVDCDSRLTWSLWEWVLYKCGNDIRAFSLWTIGIWCAVSLKEIGEHMFVLWYYVVTFLLASIMKHIFTLLKSKVLVQMVNIWNIESHQTRSWNYGRVERASNIQSTVYTRRQVLTKSSMTHFFVGRVSCCCLCNFTVCKSDRINYNKQHTSSAKTGLCNTLK